MDSLEIKQLADSQVEIGGELAAAAFETYRRPALLNLNREIKLDGFRPGTAPEAVLVSRVGEEKVLLEMAELALREHYPKLVAENKIDAIGRPEIIITKLARGNPLGFKIRVAVMPELKLGDYRAAAKKVNAAPPATHGGPSSVSPVDRRRLQIIEAVIAETELVLPAILIDGELDRMIAELRAEMEPAGLKFDDYLKHLKKSEADLRTAWRDGAAKRVKVSLILAKIAAAEKLSKVEEVWQFLENQ